MGRVWKAGLLIGLVYLNSPLRDDPDLTAISQGTLEAATPIVANGLKASGTVPSLLADPFAKAALDTARAAVGLPASPQHVAKR